jgi:hypothetical protein
LRSQVFGWVRGHPRRAQGRRPSRSVWLAERFRTGELPHCSAFASKAIQAGACWGPLGSCGAERLGRSSNRCSGSRIWRRVWPRTVQLQQTAVLGPPSRSRRQVHPASPAQAQEARRPNGPPRRHPQADRPTRSDRGSAPDLTGPCGRLPPRPHQAGRQDLQGPVAGHPECRRLHTHKRLRRGRQLTHPGRQAKARSYGAIKHLMTIADRIAGKRTLLLASPLNLKTGPQTSP